MEYWKKELFSRHHFRSSKIVKAPHHVVLLWQHSIFSSFQILANAVPEKTGTKIYISLLQAFTMKHSAAFTPGIGITSKVSIKYIINILLYKESGKAADCTYFTKWWDPTFIHVPQTLKVLVRRTLFHFKNQLATRLFTGYRSSKQVPLEFKRLRICCSKYPLLFPSN